ncbi:MAG: hypothetical protein H7A09_09910 [Oceanospirillaceae bacterium]|nr:hypothetical protein [Oceanospirillaceae bacterium]MCP5335145.1 hypothetical protein [Oceanospirillaceae bacterium]
MSRYPIRALALTFSFSLLVACGDDSSSNNSQPEPSPGTSVVLDSVVSSTRIDASSTCLNGGVKIELGIDTNGNGRLDPVEVDYSRTQIVCNGTNGTDGENGNTGLSSLIKINESAVSDCPSGGKTILIGLDTNQNNQLDSSEVTQQETLCNLVLEGADGLNSLINSVTEAAGAQCANGGIKVETGLDLNRDQVLDASEVQATNYVCNGLRGADGADAAGETVDLSHLLIETHAEPVGNNCFHGGDKHQIGLDANQNGVLDEAEIISASFSCNPNQPPVIYFDGNESVIAGGLYQLSINSEDYDGDATEITIANKPEWLTEKRISSSRITLQGIAPQSPASDFKVEVTATDTNKNTLSQKTVTIVDGIYLYADAADVLEGDSGEQQGYFTVHLSKASASEVSFSYQISSYTSLNNQDWHAVTPYGNLIFAPGETEKQIPVMVLGDTRVEFAEAIKLDIYGVSAADDISIAPAAYLHIQNDDRMVFNIEQANHKLFYQNSEWWYLGNPVITNDFWGLIECDNACYVNAVPETELINTTGSFTVEVSDASGWHVETIDYVVLAQDSDYDGVLNSEDAFPENPHEQFDADGDGIGDNWELNNFDNLTTATSLSDFDANGILDKTAFEQGLPVNPVVFKFIDQKLPADWVSSAPYGWSVGDGENSVGNHYLVTNPVNNASHDYVKQSIEFPVTVAKSNMLISFSSLQDDYFDGQIVIYVDGKGMVNDFFLRKWAASVAIPAGKHRLKIELRSLYYDVPALRLSFDNILPGITPGDRDGDGVRNSLDAFPDRGDSAHDADADGLGDEWEFKYTGNLSALDANGDWDSDGLTNLQEFELNTHPGRADSDYDGVADGSDAFPLDYQYAQDTDQDGLADEWELSYFTDLTVVDANSDFDADGMSDADEFLNHTFPLPDADGDGVTDAQDIAPHDKRYALDIDHDALPDEWENSYAGIYAFSAEGDYDNDGRTDAREFNEGSNPVLADLKTVDDVYTVARGQTITFNPVLNDVSRFGSINIANIDLPETGSLQDNHDGSYSYTADNNRLGWLRLSYTAEDQDMTATGDIFISITEKIAPKVVSITGAAHTLALFDDGSVYAWGNNYYGQLGLGNTLNSAVPKKVYGLPAIKQISVFDNVSAAVDINGQLWGWGTYNTLQTPVIKTSLTNIQQIALGSTGYALLNDGTVCRFETYNEFTSCNLIAGLENIQQIAAGASHLLALDPDGDVWALGSNDYGQLGNSSNVYAAEPVRVSKIAGIAKIYARGGSSFAVDDNGQLFAWGYNGNYQLGDGTGINRNVPVTITLVEPVLDITMGNYKTYMSTVSGLYRLADSLWSISTGDIQPVYIGSGNNSLFMIDSDGIAYGMGENNYGQLGDGTTNPRSDFVAISWLQNAVLPPLGVENFEWGRMPFNWRNSGNNWQIDETEVYAGQYAVKVRDSLTDYGSANLGLQIDTAAGDVTFKIKTSTEADYDNLIFYIDGIEVARFSGENDWMSAGSYEIAAGNHTFEWIYQKDGGTSAGQDSVWLDDIEIPIDSDGDGLLDSIDSEPYKVN